jgi:preprotein translocase subunit Sec61beta
MSTLSTPQQQAGILSFYDAPEQGPQMNAKALLIAVILFALIVLVFNHFAVA